MQISCFECELRGRGLFKPINPNELGAINDIKRDHIALAAGAEIIRAGDESPEYTRCILVGRSGFKHSLTAADRY